MVVAALFVVVMLLAECGGSVSHDGAGVIMEQQ